MYLLELVWFSVVGYLHVYILSQRANVTVDYVANFVRLVQYKKFENIMPNYLSIAWNISFNRQSLDIEEATNLIEEVCL